MNIAKQIADDYVLYALSTLNRSLPTSIDGLKSVQRRIMQTSLNMQAGQWQKVSRIAGETMAKYHPHGDCSGAITCMANSADFNHPLIDGHGNFGGWSAESRQRISADGPAASRYIEARASSFARAIFDIPEHLLERSTSYDGRAQEVTCYVPAVPLALLNGAIGIATGYATHNANFNLREIADVLGKHLRNGDKLKQARLLPDWPSRPRILVTEDSYASVQKGHGSLKLRGSWELDTKKRTIYITALPLHDAETYINKVVKAKQADQLPLLTNIRDLSNRHGIRIAIECKNGNKLNTLLAQLLRCTPLEASFSINSTMVSAETKVPIKLGMASALYAWLSARREILLKKFGYDKAIADARLEIVQGLLILAKPEIAKAVVNLVIACDSQEQAMRMLSDPQNELGFTEAQAKAIIALPIGKLTKQNKQALLDEERQLEHKIAELDRLINDKSSLDGYIADQLDALADTYGYDRLSKLETNWAIKRAELPAKPKPISELARFKQLTSRLNPPIPQKAMKRALNYKSVKSQIFDSQEQACKALVKAHIVYWQAKGKQNKNPYDAIAELCSQANLDQLNAKFRAAKVKRMTLKQLEVSLNKYITLEQVAEKHIAYWSTH